MKELLLELFSEEIPARMQENAAKYLHKTVCDTLSKQGLNYQSAHYYYTPRRLVLHVEGLDPHIKSSKEEKRGPKLGASEQAINGFAKTMGLDKAQLDVQDTPKGQFYFAVKHIQARPTSEVIADMMPAIIENFSWPKSMRWGRGHLKWVRPLHHILCLFDGQIVPFKVADIVANNFTFGHRFLAPQKIEVNNFQHYQRQLEEAYVILNQDKRQKLIIDNINNLIADKKIDLIEDQGLLHEVSALVEYPVPLLGEIHSDFQDLPAELLVLTMKVHQKYFSLKSQETGKITHFITVANMKTQDEGRLILNGNQRVLAARLGDAQFFYQQDLQKPLLEHGKKLQSVTYHAKLGTQVDRISRISVIAEMLAIKLYPDIALEDVKRTALLIKCDLMSEAVGEFPELQGIMGKYYADAQGEKKHISEAIEAHYLPKGSADKTPQTPLSVIMALADRLDQLCGFWVIDEKPTGSKDPFALRRAALGIIRILNDNQLDLNLLSVIGIASNMYQPYGNIEIIEDLFQFFHDRIKVYLKDFKIRHDHISAVLFGDNFTHIIQNAHTLHDYMQQETGIELVKNYKRAANILKAEEKKDQTTYNKMPQIDALSTAQEKLLAQNLAHIISVAQEGDSFTVKMTRILALNSDINSFFEAFIINDSDPVKRLQRLNLIGVYCDLCEAICEFQKLNIIVHKKYI